MHNLIISPRKYRLNFDQISNLAAEYYGQSLSPINSDELTLEFDNAVNLNKFKAILNEKFLLD